MPLLRFDFDAIALAFRRKAKARKISYRRFIEVPLGCSWQGTLLESGTQLCCLNFT
jgi:hypothetical protein